MGWMLKHQDNVEVHHIKSDVFVIGRDKQANIICRNILVSKDHSRITREKDGQLAIVDLNSANGTYVNCEKIKPNKKMILKEGDQVSFGMMLDNQNDGLVIKKPHYVYKVCKVPDVIEILTSDDEVEENTITKKDKPAVFFPNSGKSSIDGDEILKFRSTQKQPPKTNENRPISPENNKNIPVVKIRAGTKSTGSNVSADTISQNNENPRIINNENNLQIDMNENNFRTKINVLEHLRLIKNLQTKLNEVKQLKVNENDQIKLNGIEKENVSEQLKVIENVEFTRTLRSKTSREKSLTNGLADPSTSANLPTCSKYLQTGNSNVVKTEMIALKSEKPTPSKTLDNVPKMVVKSEGRKNADNNVVLGDKDVNLEFACLHPHLPRRADENMRDIEASKNVQNEDTMGKIHIAKNLFNNTEKPLQNENCSNNEPKLLGHVIKQEQSTQDYSKEDNVVPIGSDDDEEGDMFMFSQLYVKDEIKVEEIIEYEDTSPKNNYLNDENNVILIDDDDDELFSAVCSQMYIKEESFNNENVENEGGINTNAQKTLMNEHGEVNDEEYMNIKREVAAMDKFDDPTLLPPIPIDDSMEFSDSEDIFNLASKEIAAEASTSKENTAVLGSYTKPPIIEPHQIKPITRPKRQASSKLKEVVPAKKIKTPTKRTRGKRKLSPVKKSVTKDKEIQEARRQKLKEIASKAAPKPKGKTEEDHKKITTAKHTKTSTGRGNFLLPADNAPSTSKPGSIALRHEQIKKCTLSTTQKRFIDEYRDVVQSIIMWNQKWINEQRGKDLLPPVAGKEIIKMCDSFSSHKDYYAVLQPLIITELWFNFCKEYEGSSFSNQINSSGNHIAKISSVKIHDFYTEITCDSYLNKKSNECGDHLQMRNVVLLNAYFGSEKNSCKTFFGVVIWSRKDHLKFNSNMDNKMVQACGSMPTTKLSFVLAVKKFADTINQNIHINMRYFTFLPQYLRLISSIKALNTSPLLNHVIDPKYSDYVIKDGKKRNLLGEDNLNESQKEAINDVMSLYENQKPGLYLIEGPPGTGKSTVIINILLEFLLNQDDRNGCLLLLAPSNGAIDSIINKIMFVVKPNLKEEDRQKIKLVRVGNANAIDQNIFKYSLEEIAKAAVHHNFMKEHPQTHRDYEYIGQQMKELREKLNRDPSDVHLIREMEKKMAERSNFAQNFLKSKYRFKLDEQRLVVLSHANIICSTIMSSPKILLKGFDVNTIRMCIIDEASQCSEPESLVPVGLGINKIVLVGDPQQLPAFSPSILVKNYGYCRSLFTRVKLILCRQKVNPIKMLNIQYRMHPEISHFPNHEYYNGKLQTNFLYKKKPLEQLRPYLVFSQSFINTKVYENLKEIELLMILIKAISNVVVKECSFSIGIITPYSIQRKSINTELNKLGLRRNISVTCNTVDSFQGQEKDIILFSCVRNMPNSFLSDQQRINVTITRAKCALYIIGTETLLQNCTALKKILSDAQKRKLYHKLKVNMTESSFRDLISKRK